MSTDELYTRLLSDPIWGSEIRLLASLDQSRTARPAVVGGAVRDLVIERPITDLDISTAFPDTARILAKAFADATGRHLIEYSHGQEIFRVTAQNAHQVDFTDPVGGTRESDLLRRDFTINAMAVELSDDSQGGLIDPTGGINDIRNKIVRMTSPDVLDDDPLRLLRAFRFSAQLGFCIDPETLDAIAEKHNLLRHTAGERIQSEILATLEPQGARKQVEKMDLSGVLRILFPELQMQKDVEQNAYHHLPVWEHTLESLDHIERILQVNEDVLKLYKDKLLEYVNYKFPSGYSRKSLIKLAMLLHDIAKPHCKAIRDDGRITFIGHERLGADICRDHLSRLKFSNQEKGYVCSLIVGHLRPAIMGRDEPDRPRVAHRFFRDCGDASLGIILMSFADRLAAQGELVTEKVNERHRTAVAFLLDSLFNRTEVIVRPPQLIDGGVLIRELGLEPGPIIGHLLKRVQEAQVMNEVRTKDEALEYCRKIVSESK